MSTILNWLNANPGPTQAGAGLLQFIASLVLVCVTAWYVSLTQRLAKASRDQLELATTPNLIVTSFGGNLHVVNLSPGHVWIHRIVTYLPGSTREEFRPKEPSLSSGDHAGIHRELLLKVHRARDENDSSVGSTWLATFTIEVEFFHGPSGPKLFTAVYKWDEVTETYKAPPFN